MIKNKWLILATLYLIVFLNSFGYFVTIPVLVRIIMDPTHQMISAGMMHTFGSYIYSIVLGAGSLSSIVFAPILGRFSDQIGRKKVLLVCTVLTLISFILPIVSIMTNSLLLFVLGNFVNGISSNNQPIAQAAITDISQKKRSRAIRFAFDTVVICLAMVLSPVVSELLSDHHLASWFNNTTPFIFAGTLALVGLVLVYFVLPETYKKAKDETKLTYHNSFGSFSDFFKLNPSIIRCLLVFLLAQTSWAEFYQYFYIYLQTQFHFSVAQLATYNSLIGVYLIFGLLVVYPFLIRVVSFRRSVTICLAICVIGALIIGFVHQPWAQWLGIIPLAVCIGMYFPSLLTIFSQSMDEHNQGWIMSISMGLIGVGWFVTGFTSIYFSKISANMPMQVVFILLAVACGLMMLENHWHKRAQNEHRSNASKSEI